MSQDIYSKYLAIHVLTLDHALEPTGSPERQNGLWHVEISAAALVSKMDSGTEMDSLRFCRAYFRLKSKYTRILFSLLIVLLFFQSTTFLWSSSMAWGWQERDDQIDGELIRQQRESDARLLREHDIEPTLDSITKYLRSIQPSADHRERCQELIEQLGHPSFAKRKAAQAELIRLRFMDFKLLEQAMNSTDTEVRMRAKAVFDVHNSNTVASQRNDLLSAVCRVVRHHQFKGLCESLVTLLPSVKPRYLKSQITTTVKEIATQDDLQDFNRFLKSEHESIRVAAITTIDAITGGDNLKQEVAAMFNDPSDRVRIEAALVRSNRGDRQGLVVLVDLLSSPDPSVRLQSIRQLSAMTGQRFDYAVNAPISEFLSSTRKWEAWIAGDGRSAPIKFPVQREFQVTDGLVLYYVFDNQNHEVHDQSGNGNHGHVQGDPKVTVLGDELIGRAIKLNGKSDYIARDYDSEDGLHPTESPFTVSAFFKTSSSSPQEQTILSTHCAGMGHDGYKFTIDNRGAYNGKLVFMIGAGGHHVLVSRQPCDDGDWHHAIGVWDGKTATLYIDGAMQETIETSGEIPYSNSAPFTVGHSATVGGAHALSEKYFFNGEISNVRVYSRALTLDEIQTLSRQP